MVKLFDFGLAGLPGFFRRVARLFDFRLAGLPRFFFFMPVYCAEVRFWLDNMTNVIKKVTVTIFRRPEKKVTVTFSGHLSGSNFT
jgi:hypothetical protein